MVKLKKAGGGTESLTLSSIPNVFVEKLEWGDGDEVEVTIPLDDRCLIIRKKEYEFKLTHTMARDILEELLIRKPTDDEIDNYIMFVQSRLTGIAREFIKAEEKEGAENDRKTQ